MNTTTKKLTTGTYCHNFAGDSNAWTSVTVTAVTPKTVRFTTELHPEDGEKRAKIHVDSDGREPEHAEKIGVERVDFSGGEHAVFSGGTLSFDSMRAAQALLELVAASRETDGGYTKTFGTIFFADGSLHHFRVDVVSADDERADTINDLAGHVRRALEYVAKREDNFARSVYSEADAIAARDRLDRYAIA